MSQRRRTRYTAFLRSGANPTIIKHVILAYNAAYVREYYGRRGYIVLGVEKGDYRVKAAASATSGARLRLSAKALREARAFLDITYSIDLHFSSRVGNTRGNHRAMMAGPAGWQHRIMVKSYLDPAQASRVLWHELAHAMQFERDIVTLGLSQSESVIRWHKNYRDGTTYRNKPYEVEARSFEAYADEMPLFVP